MNRVIFIYDISDLYTIVEEEAEKLLTRKPELRTKFDTFQLVRVWLRHRLWRDLFLNITRTFLVPTEEELDWEFLGGQHQANARLYNQIRPTLHLLLDKVIHGWVELTVTRHDMMLTYRIHPYDHSVEHFRG